MRKECLTLKITIRPHNPSTALSWHKSPVLAPKNHKHAIKRVHWASAQTGADWGALEPCLNGSSSLCWERLLHPETSHGPQPVEPLVSDWLLPLSGFSSKMDSGKMETGKEMPGWNRKWEACPRRAWETRGAHRGPEAVFSSWSLALYLGCKFSQQREEGEAPCLENALPKEGLQASTLPTCKFSRKPHLWRLTWSGPFPADWAWSGGISPTCCDVLDWLCLLYRVLILCCSVFSLRIALCRFALGEKYILYMNSVWDWRPPSSPWSAHEVLLLPWSPVLRIQRLALARAPRGWPLAPKRSSWGSRSAGTKPWPRACLGPAKRLPCHARSLTVCTTQSYLSVRSSCQVALDTTASAHHPSRLCTQMSGRKQLVRAALQDDPMER